MPSRSSWTRACATVLRGVLRGYGAPGRTRTADAGLRTASLYPLSYGGADGDGTAARPAGPIERSPQNPGRRDPQLEFRHGRSDAARGGGALPDLILYSRAGLPPVRRGPGRSCAHCSSRARRPAALTPRLVERDITTDPDWERAFFATIPVVELGDRRLELATSAAKLRALLATLDEPAAAATSAATPGLSPVSTMPPVVDPRGTSSGVDLTLAVAIAAGLISFLSPCVLPLVPAYLGQLTAVAVAANPDGRRPVALARAAARRRVRRRLRARVHGARRHGHVRRRARSSTTCPLLRQIGGIVLIVLGLNLAGVLPIPRLERAWRPLDAGASTALATMTGTTAFAPGTAVRTRPGWIASGAGIVRTRGGWLTSFGLGAIFAVGWTPCIGVDPRRHPGPGRDHGHGRSRAACSCSRYTIGLGLPFLVLGALYDRAPALTRPLVAHGSVVSFIGGTARRRDRRRDAHGLAGAPAALLPVQHGDL